jgi:hypothetical protein
LLTSSGVYQWSLTHSFLLVLQMATVLKFNILTMT